MKAKLLLALTVAGGIAIGSSAFPQATQATQAPARDTVKPRTGTARIRGRVLAADTSAPIRRAIVRLTAPELGDQRSRMTDADGRYDFRDLPPGNYLITASKTGFLSGGVGATRPEDMPKAVKLGEAEVATADDVILMRACAIAGRVVDDFGDPVSDAQIRVLRYQSVGGVRRLMPNNGASTNDLGQFRVYALQPGTYFVSAQALMGLDSETDDHMGYAPTYYPGAANPSEAQPVQVSPGQDLGGIEIMLTTVRVARVSGVALDSRGRPAPNAAVTASLIAPGLAFSDRSAYGRVLPDGTFTMNAVPPGDYLLELRISTNVLTPSVPPAPRTEYGRARVVVAGSDVTGVMIQASAGATVSGQVVFDGGAPPPKSAMTVTAAAAPTFVYVTSPPTGPPAQVGADGTFVLTGVFGDRVFRVGGQPTGWVLKAVYVGGRDMTDTPVSVEGREQIAGVQIVLTDRVTHVTGTIKDERDQPADSAYILILPDDPARLTPGSRFQRMAMVRAGTPLKIDGLPPGDYIALALKSIPRDFDPWDPESFEYARKAGTRFSLREAETRDLTLRLVEAPAR
jgi:hypothetical protein